MPIVPLYNDGQPQRAARRPSQAVTGNPAGGVRVTIGGLADDLQQPLMGTEGVIAQGRAGAQLGQAIAGVGGMVQNLAMERMEAQNKIDVAAAEAKMDEHAASFETWKLENPDPRTWEDGWKKHMEGFSPLDDKMSPAAREAASGRFTLFQGQAALTVSRDATKQTFANAKNLFSTRAQIAARNGDVEGVQKIFQENGKYFQPGEDEGMLDYAQKSRERLDKQAALETERAKVNSAYQIALDNPDEFLAKPDTYTEGLDPQDKDSLMTQARQQIAQRQSDATNELSDRLAAGEFKTMADLRAAFPEEVPPRVRKQFESLFERAQTPGIRAKLEADAPQNFARFSDVVEKYDAKDDPEGVRYAQIVMSVKQSMPEELRGEILGPLYKKRPGVETNIDAPEPLKATVRDIVGTMFDAEAFGKYKVPSATEPGKMVDDPKAKAAAYAKKGNVMIYMSKWMAANPDAPAEKALEAVRAAAGGVAPVIRSTIPRAEPPDLKPGEPFKPTKATPVAPWEMDLPDEGGPSSPLIPFFLPSDLQGE